MPGNPLAIKGSAVEEPDKQALKCDEVGFFREDPLEPGPELSSALAAWLCERVGAIFFGKTPEMQGEWCDSMSYRGPAKGYHLRNPA